LVGQKTDKIAYWRNSSQKQRWVATSLLYIEQRLNKVNGYRHLGGTEKGFTERNRRYEERKEAVAA
jgi:hypothetical protein